MDQLQGLVLTKVAREDVVVLVLHDSESEVVGGGYINPVVKSRKSVRSDGPSSFRFREVGRDRGVERKGGQDVGVKGVEVKDGGCVEGRGKEVGGVDRSCKLFMSKDRSTVMRIDRRVAIIPPFWVDVPTSSKSVRFSSELSGTEADD